MTIDSELEGLITTFIMQYDQRVKIGNKRNIEAVERHQHAITNLIAQEANKAVVAELERMLPPNEIHVSITDYATHRIKALTADKEQA